MEQESIEHIYLAVPSGEGKIGIETLHTILAGVVAPGPNRMAFIAGRGESLLCHNFNALWADCLNLREELNIRWFVMLHADVSSPDPNWLEKLLALAEANRLDALSAAVRIKGEDRDTSTALWKAGNIERLSLRDWTAIPPTCDHFFIKQFFQRTLLINTGMLALRVDTDWAKGFCWRMEDQIVFHSETGRFEARTLPEDWKMSLLFAEAGIRYGVTREVLTEHSGMKTWRME